ncbi:MAG: tRNA preQ1(34) S-adenosylmethionine ribosyltransferase-isomerase QueA [Ruminococcaceae bacterium]|nr:tRNA preQ1(34) S-adenosylmethionine ribosyltransferase-isomerase QueA [Oscillospiraceae bacterium]
MDLLKRSSYYYDLPQELIAQTPSEKRDHSRLLCLDKENGNIQHKTFYDIIDSLKEGDCLVINDTKVIPARLFGKAEGREGEIETVLLSRMEDAEGETWKCLTRPGKKTRVGAKIVYSDELCGIVTDVLEGGIRVIRFEYNGVFNEILDRIGIMPLPPYITEKLKDRNRYQTVYAKTDGSAAAPTAGLHFTPELLKKAEEKGVEIVRVLLHVGLGTFRPVKEDDLSNHTMHAEYIKVTKEAADKINEIRAKGGRIIAVGTTSVRTLESATDDNGIVKPFEGETSIFIHPGVKFKCVDAMITNFHLPESTLIMLVCAFAGYDNTMAAYNEAVTKKYRFFSFGDAMLIQ